MERNRNMTRLKASYLFPEINARKRQFLAQHPEASLISLGIGDTTEPIPGAIAQALVEASAGMGSVKGYVGYGPEQGMKALREKIALKLYSNRVSPDDIFISDGAKCDIGRLQMLFGEGVTIAIQDPAYPVYVDGSLIQGVKKIIWLPCLPENHFFPDLEKLENVDLIYFCSPNNPTGTVATRAQLEKLVQFAVAHRSIILFDAAYSHYIQDPKLPRSIFEIEGARKVAIEMNSFSKLAGFTGVRLGWTVVSDELKYDDGTSVKADWSRVMSTVFNGASHISQTGGCAALESQGLQEIDALIAFYMENARILKEACEALGYEVFGGVNAPYLWVRVKGRNSWDVFQEFLDRYQLVITPGAGFGPAGEGFIRLTAFGHRENIVKAVERLRKG